MKSVLGQHWKYLGYRVVIPCSSNGCPASFEWDGLLRLVPLGQYTVRCAGCDKQYNIFDLIPEAAYLTASALEPTGSRALARSHEILHADIERLTSSVDILVVQTGLVVGWLRNVLKVLSLEVSDCPRLFTLSPIGRSGLRHLRPWQRNYRLTLWCEQPGQEHPYQQATYTFSRPEQWFRQVAPYALLVSKALQLLVPVLGAGVALVLSDSEMQSIKDEIEFTKALVDELPVTTNLDDGLMGSGQLTTAQGAGLRAFRSLLFSLDTHRSLWLACNAIIE